VKLVRQRREGAIAVAGLVVALITALAASVLLRGCAPRLERHLTPSALVRLCTAAAVSTALTLGCALAAMGLAVVGRNTDVAEVGRWSAGTLEELIPVPVWIGITAGAVFVVLATNTVWHAVGLARDLVTAELIGRRLRSDSGRMIVLDDEKPDAYALAGLRGYVVVTTGMLRSLPSNEQAVLLAHETSHLRNRHHLYVQLAGLAATANPLLEPIAAAVRHGVERWADEDAAATAGDRRLAARAVARAALARAHSTRLGAPSLAAADGRVADRANALLAPPPAHHRAVPAALLALTTVVTSVTAITLDNVQADFANARHVAAVACPKSPSRFCEADPEP
jgi:hypothetical protein